MTLSVAASAAGRPSAQFAAADLLPAPEAWRAAAAQHDALFAPLDAGVRIGLLARSAPTRMLVWDATNIAVEAQIEQFEGYASCDADIVLAADDESLAAVRASAAPAVFEVLREGIRSGRIVCYTLKRRCVLEERGCDELLDALGFAFMGACR